jgi:hypothetical protein
MNRFQGPLSRFGDTAANAGIMALLESVSWPVLIKTVFGSMAAASFRMVLTPIDTLKTTQQTRGAKEGMKLLRQRIRENGVGCLWWGALATAAATFVGNCECSGVRVGSGYDFADSRRSLVRSGCRRIEIGDMS